MSSRHEYGGAARGLVGFSVGGADRGFLGSKKARPQRRTLVDPGLSTWSNPRMRQLPDTFLVTDGRGDPERIRRLVTAVVRGGIRGVQLREPDLSAAILHQLCVDLRPQLDGVDGCLIVNDRADVAAARGVDGVQLGHRSLPPSEVRGFLPPSRIIGASVHQAEEMLPGAVATAADFLVLAPLFATACKPGVDPVGPEIASRWIAACALPVLVLGGITEASAPAAREIGASGIAVMGALCNARDPAAMAAALVATGASNSV